MTHTHRLQIHDVPTQTVNPHWEEEKLKTAAPFIVIAMKTFAPTKPIRDSGGGETLNWTLPAGSGHPKN